jgi:hypothetical protein
MMNFENIKPGDIFKTITPGFVGNDTAYHLVRRVDSSRFLVSSLTYDHFKENWYDWESHYYKFNDFADMTERPTKNNESDGLATKSNERAWIKFVFGRPT